MDAVFAMVAVAAATHWHATPLALLLVARVDGAVTRGCPASVVFTITTGERIERQVEERGAATWTIMRPDADGA